MSSISAGDRWGFGADITVAWRREAPSIREADERAAKPFAKNNALMKARALRQP